MTTDYRLRAVCRALDKLDAASVALIGLHVPAEAVPLLVVTREHLCDLAPYLRAERDRLIEEARKKVQE